MSELTLEEKAAQAFEGLMGDRWAVRCQHCLSIAFVTVSPPAVRAGNTNGWLCKLCKGPIETMGKVEWDRLMKHVEESVCDGRCTHARGALCICFCRGKNHGTGRTVTVSYDLGEAPCVNMPPSEEALETAAEFLTARDMVKKIADDLVALKNTRRTTANLNTGQYYGTYLTSQQYSLMIAAQRAVLKATKAKTHDSRMKTLDQALAQYAALEEATAVA